MFFNRLPLKLRWAIALAFATWAFTLWGYIWYATIFDDVWQVLIDRSEDELNALAAARGPLNTVFYYVISLVQVIGVFVILKISKTRTWLQHIGMALLISLFLSAPMLGNSVLFADTPIGLWLLDSGHFLFGYIGIALVYFLLLGNRNDQTASGNDNPD